LEPSSAEIHIDLHHHEALLDSHIYAFRFSLSENVTGMIGTDKVPKIQDTCPGDAGSNGGGCYLVFLRKRNWTLREV